MTTFSLGVENERLTRDGKAESFSRDQILRRERGQKNCLSYPVQLNTSRISNHMIPLDVQWAIFDDHNFLAHIYQNQKTLGGP